LLPIGGYKATEMTKPKVKFEPCALLAELAWSIQVTLPHGERINVGRFDAEKEAANWIAAHSAKWIKKYRGGRYVRAPLTRQSPHVDKVAGDDAPIASLRRLAKEPTAPRQARAAPQGTSGHRSRGKSAESSR
jgi:hypothetical protein